MIADLVTIDPGVRYVATAWWRLGRLVHLARLQQAPGVRLPDLWVDLLRVYDPDGSAQVLVEDPQDYGDKGAKAPTLAAIRRTSASLEDASGPSSRWSRVRPGVWKGSVPKDVHHRRIAEALVFDEAVLARTLGALPSINGTPYDLDLADAIGIGLWRLGRLGRGGVRVVRP